MMLYSHEQLYIHLCMQKHLQHNKDERHSSLEKYTSHFIWKGSKGYYCARGELETEQNCNILTSILLAITAFLSRSPGLLIRGPGRPASAGTWFSFQHLLSNWFELLSPVLYNNLTPTYFLRVSQFRTQFNPSTVKVTPDLISSTRCTCYFHSLVGSEVNMQQWYNAQTFWYICYFLVILIFSCNFWCLSYFLIFSDTTYILFLYFLTLILFCSALPIFSYATYIFSYFLYCTSNSFFYFSWFLMFLIFYI